jgi:inorganic pyrophosphatase
MPAAYGYIKRTEGADGDHVDIYLGPHKSAPNIYVVDQVDAQTRKFDEHKCLIGFASAKQARNCYVKAFSDGKGHARLDAMHEMTIAQFKDWLAKGDTSKAMAA